MNAIKDGGSAFPIPGTASHQHDAGCGDVYTVKGREPAGGMSLRDYFAAKAMQAVICEPQWSNGGDYSLLGQLAAEHAREPAAQITHVAYILADAMLAAREEVRP